MKGLQVSYKSAGWKEVSMDIKLIIFKAVAHEKRIRLIKLFYEEGRMPLRDISDLMDVPEATA